MDVDQIFNQITNLPDEIKKLVIKGMIAASIGSKKAENEILKNSQQMLHSGDAIVQKYYSNQVLGDLIEGKLNERTKAFAERFFRLLEESDKYTSSHFDHSTGKVVMNVKDDKYQELLLEKLNSLGDKSDNFPLEFSMEVKKFLLNEDYVFKNTKPEYSYNLLIHRDFQIHENKMLENYVYTVHVRTKNNNEKIVEFYSNIESNKTFNNELINFEGFALVKSKYRTKTFYYKNNGLYKITNHNGNKVIKLNTTLINES